MDKEKISEQAIAYLGAQLVETPICCYQANHNGMIQAAIDALQEKHDPKPLTICQFYARVGRPVFLVGHAGTVEGMRDWRILKRIDTAPISGCGLAVFGDDETLALIYYYEAWLAYDQEPKTEGPKIPAFGLGEK